MPKTSLLSLGLRIKPYGFGNFLQGGFLLFCALLIRRMAGFLWWEWKKKEESEFIILQTIPLLERIGTMETRFMESILMGVGGLSSSQKTDLSVFMGATSS